MNRKSVTMTIVLITATSAGRLKTVTMIRTMITRDEIRSIPELYKSIQRDKEQLRYLREKATSVPSGISDRERVQTSPSNDGMKYVEEAADLDKDIRRKELELLELQSRAKLFIDTIDKPLTMRVMKRRYLKCETWEEIADMLGYDDRYIRRLEYEAVELI